VKVFRKLLLLVTILALAATHPSVQTLAAMQAAPAFPQQEQAADFTKAPAMVFLIRHAEKPLGEGKDPNLTPTGFKRANALPSLFLQQPGSSKLPRFPRPDAIFATDTAKHSNRPIETITPLSQALHVPVNHSYEDRETAAVAKEVLGGKYVGKVVLVCWHHGEIPHLAQAFGVTTAPHTWNDTVFDQIWMIEYIDGKPQFSVLPESLLPGDSSK